MAKNKAPAGVKPTNTPWWQPDWSNPFRFAGTGGVVPGFQAPSMRSPDIEQSPWFTPYGPATVDPYFTRWQQQQPSNVPPAATATPTSAAPTLAGVGAIPEYPMYGPPLPGATTAQEYAPNMTTGGSGSYGNPDYNYWVNLAQKQEQWTPEEQAAYLAQFYGQTDEQGNLIGVGNPRWGDPYQVMPYWKYDQPTWIAGREGGASSMGRGRRPKSSYLPEQQQYMDADGNKWFERPETDRRTRMQKFLDEQNPSGNNTSKTIPAWVGPLVSWRT